MSAETKRGDWLIQGPWEGEVSTGVNTELCKIINIVRLVPV